MAEVDLAELDLPNLGSLLHIILNGTRMRNLSIMRDNCRNLNDIIDHR